jgi:hypothetical protein
MDRQAASTGEIAVIDRTAPIKLSRAVELAFPDGGMTVSGLRHERDHGRLVIFKVAGKDFTTLADIDRMIEKCREDQKARGSISKARDQPETGNPPSAPSGSSETAGSSAALAQARAKVEKLKRPSRPTSTPKPHRGLATVTPLRAGSQT